MNLFNRIMKKSRQRVSLNEEEELGFIEEGESPPDIEGGETIPEKKFTAGEKIIISVAGVASFLIFFIILLPYDLVTVTLVNRVISPAKITYSSIDFNLFGPEEIGDFQYSSGSYNLQSRGIVLDTSLTALLFRGMLRGDVSVISPHFQMPSSSVSVKTLNGNFDLNDVTGPVSSIQGDVSLQAAGVDLSGLNLPNIPIPLNELLIKRIVILGDVGNGSLQIRKGSVQTNLFDITLSGRIFLASSPSQIRLENRICVKATPEAEASESGLYGMFVMAAGTPTEEACFNITGTVQNPSFQKE